MTQLEREMTFSSNASYMIGLYKGLLNILLDEAEIKGANKSPISPLYVKMAKDNMALAERIWDNRYEKHYNEVVAEVEAEKLAKK